MSRPALPPSFTAPLHANHPRLRRPPVPHRRRPPGPGVRRRRHALVGRGTGRAAPLGPRRPAAARLAPPGGTGHRVGVQPGGAASGVRQRRPVGLGRRHRRAGGVVAAAVLGDGRRLLAGRRRAGRRLRRRPRPPLGLAQADAVAGNPRPPIAPSAPWRSARTAAAWPRPARTGPFTSGTRRPHEPLGSLIGHTDRIPGLVWHPDGRRLYSAGWDTTARVWDVEKCEPIILLNSHAGQVHALALSADGSALACADSANTIHIWDTNRNRELHVTAAQSREVRALAFAPDGRRLASGGTEHVIHLWDSDKAQEERRRGRPADDCAPASRSARTAGGSWRWGPARRWASGKRRIRRRGRRSGGRGELRAFAASPDGRWIAGSRAGDDDDEQDAANLALWDAATGRRVALLRRAGRPRHRAGLLRRLRLAGDGRLPQQRRVAVEHPRRQARAAHPRRGRRLLGGGAGVPPGQARAGGGRHRLDGDQRRGRLRGAVGRGTAEADRRLPRRRGRPGVPPQRPATGRRFAGADEFASSTWTKTPWRRNGPATPTR